MKTCMTPLVAPVSSKTIRHPGLLRYKIANEKSLLGRFRHFIESTDWEERYLCNHWVDKICLGGVVASLIYFIPLLFSILRG
jgi:hypothetical protein